MSAKHKSWPWVVAEKTEKEDGILIRSENDKYLICLVFRAMKHIPGPNEFSDGDFELSDYADWTADLIAAAPDLLEALRDIVSSYEIIGVSLDLEQEIRNAKAAIAKAEGDKA